MNYELRKLDNDTINELIELSKKWVEEDCSRGIITNTKEDLNEPLFVAIDNNKIIGYIFGHYYLLENKALILRQIVNALWLMKSMYYHLFEIKM